MLREPACKNKTPYSAFIGSHWILLLHVFDHIDIFALLKIHTNDAWWVKQHKIVAVVLVKCSC